MRVPILCYHRIEAPPSGAEQNTNFVTPQRFAAQLTLLQRAGCRGVTVRDIVAWQTGARTLPTRSIAITFDDAYESVAEHAIPMLDALAWPCTIFAVSSEVGGSNRWDTDAPPARLMTGSTLRALASRGHEVGSHSRTHQRVRSVDASVATSELVGSRVELEQLLGAAVSSFAFPYGSHDADTLAKVRDAGYDGACTLKRWANPQAGNSLRLGRMGVGGPLPTWQFALKLQKLRLTPAWK